MVVFSINPFYHSWLQIELIRTNHFNWISDSLSNWCTAIDVKVALCQVSQIFGSILHEDLTIVRDELILVQFLHLHRWFPVPGGFLSSSYTITTNQAEDEAAVIERKSKSPHEGKMSV